MIYQNPVLRGFYPDPSVCRAGEWYYLACSSFQYFPGVPLFRSRDLVNWEQIGHALTRPSQVALETVESSGGVFAPTIRYEGGWFYMTTTNNSTGQNFYVRTRDPAGAWSEPVYVDQDGIDPSLYFEDGKAYFMSNGSDDQGVGGICLCCIDIHTGRKLSRTRCIWRGTGGRFLEGPHLYRFDGLYYLLASEGGTEYGHMLTLARSDCLWGPYESCPWNPILTNRNKAPYPIQGIGHGELITGPDGNWYVLSLGFRQTGKWLTYHHLGREVFLTPAEKTEDGWFRCGRDGTTELSYETPLEGEQRRKQLWTFENTRWDLDWCFLRRPDMDRYRLLEDRAVLFGSQVTMDEPGSPTFLGLRQMDMAGTLRCTVDADRGEAGLTLYMCEREHYDLALRRTEGGWQVLVRLCVGDVKHIQTVRDLPAGQVRLQILMEARRYHFFLLEGEQPVSLGSAETKYLSTEVSGGFTGVILGLYAQGGNRAEFTNFSCEYVPEPPEA